MKQISTAAILIVFCTTLPLATAQQEQDYRGGLIPTPISTYEGYKQYSRAMSRDLIREELLKPVVDLSDDFPVPGNQGKQLSCAGWAVAYACKTYQEKLEEGWSLKKETIFSPSFIYNQVSKGKDRGSSLFWCLNLVSRKGCASLKEMPYSESDCTTLPSREVLANAERYRISDFYIVENDVSAIRNELDQGRPVMIGMFCGINFKRHSGSGVLRYVISGYDNGEYYHSRDFFGHALCIVGYDESKRAFKIINSWGPYWGDNGYAWLHQDVFTRKIKVVVAEKVGIDPYTYRLLRYRETKKLRIVFELYAAKDSKNTGLAYRDLNEKDIEKAVFLSVSRSLEDLLRDELCRFAIEGISLAEQMNSATVDIAITALRSDEREETADKTIALYVEGGEWLLTEKSRRLIEDFVDKEARKQHSEK